MFASMSLLKYVVADPDVVVTHAQMRGEYNWFEGIDDVTFMQNLQRAFFFADLVACVKGLSLEQTVGEEGILHRLTVLMEFGADSGLELSVVREQFSELLHIR